MRRSIRYSVRLLVLIAVVASFQLLAPPAHGPATPYLSALSVVVPAPTLAAGCPDKQCINKAGGTAGPGFHSLSRSPAHGQRLAVTACSTTLLGSPAGTQPLKLPEKALEGARRQVPPVPQFEFAEQAAPGAVPPRQIPGLAQPRALTLPLLGAGAFRAAR